MEGTYPFDPERLHELEPRIDLKAQYMGNVLNLKSRWEYYNYPADGSPELHQVLIDDLGSRLAGHESILDAGCSNGEVDYRIRNELGHSGPITAFDIDNLSLPTESRIEKNGIRPINFKVGSILDIQELDNSFDVALALFILYHLPKDYDKALSELYRVTAPGALLYVATSQTGETYEDDNKYFQRLAEQRLAKYFGVKPPPKFADPFNVRIARRVLPRHGFRIIEQRASDTDMVVKEGDGSMMAYELSLDTMGSACDPPVPDHEWNQAVKTMIMPEILEYVKKHGSFKDRINRRLFICEKIG